MKSPAQAGGGWEGTRSRRRRGRVYLPWHNVVKGRGFEAQFATERGETRERSRHVDGEKTRSSGGTAEGKVRGGTVIMERDYCKDQLGTGGGKSRCAHREGGKEKITRLEG